MAVQRRGETDDEFRQRKTEDFFDEVKGWAIIIVVILAFGFVIKKMGEAPPGTYEDPPPIGRTIGGDTY